MKNQTPKNRTLFFIALLTIVTVAANFLASNFADSPIASLMIMWSLGLAEIIASLLMRRSLKEIGWRP